MLLIKMSSSINSSSTPLAANGEFPGAWEFLTVDKHGVELVCSTDAPGNLIVEFSQNKLDINYTHTFSIQADVSFSQAVSKKGNYYKVSLVNGSSPQTTLQLVSIIQTTYQPDNLDVELDSATSSITIFGQDSDGTKRVVKTTTDGSLVISGGGASGGDASSANQLLQITQATNSNLAVCSRLDTIDVSANNMEIQLDKLTFTTGNLLVRDTACLAQQQASNLVLADIATATEDMLLSVDGINTKLSPLKVYEAKYNIEAATLLESPGQNPSYTTPPSELGIPASEGYYYKNSVLGASQLYYYSWLNLAAQPAAQTKPFRLDAITNSYAVLRVGCVDTTASIPFIGIYTRPEGAGDFIPGFARSRRVYTLPAQSLTQGMKFIIWWGTVAPHEKIWPGVPRIQATLAVANGPQLGTELVGFMSVNSDSGAAINKVEYIVSGAGWKASLPGGDEEYNSTFSGESSTTASAGDATSANQISSNLAICARLDTANNTLGLINTNLDQLTYSGSNLYVLDAQTRDELITLNGTMTDLITGTSQLSVALDPANDGVSLYAFNTTSMMPEALTLSTDSGMKALDVHVVNQPSGYATESTLADISELVSNQSAFSRFQTEAPVSDGKLDTIITNMNLTNFNVNNLTKCDTDNVAIPGGVDINNLPTIQQVSLGGESVSISGTVPISSGSPLDVHCYGSSDGVNYHLLKTNPQGVLKTNAIMESDENGALTSELKTGTGAYNALHCWVKNSITLDAGSTTNITALDPIATKSQSSLNSEIANDVIVSAPVSIGVADSDGYLWVSAQIQINECTSGGMLYLEYSAEGAIWFRGNASGESVYVNPSVVQQRLLIRPQTPTTMRYVRVYAEGTFAASGVSAWVSMK